MKPIQPSTKSTKTTQSSKPLAKPSASIKKAATKKTVAKKVTTQRFPPKPQPVPVVAASNPATKQSQLISLLGSSTGATLAQMMKLTGWQSHTVRGMLSGSLRKRLGLKVELLTENGVRVYRIVGGAAQ